MNLKVPEHSVHSMDQLSWFAQNDPERFKLQPGQLGHDLCLDNNGLRWGKVPLAKHLEVPELGDVNEGGVVCRRLLLGVRREERPKLVDVDGGAVELVPQLVKVPHTHLPEVPRVVLVEEDPVVVEATSITATTGVLPVLADTSVTGANMTSLLPVLLEPGRHLLRRRGRARGEGIGGRRTLRKGEARAKTSMLNH
ncbi:hypothetical protein EJ110_NYTH32983 [Nymphaea thermarum]|nr:hypothetical protein EJ110_NYTH32983 [Nymphaea thermarum]